MTKNILESHLSKKLSFNEIAKVENLSLGTIVYWANKYGLKSGYTPFTKGTVGKRSALEGKINEIDWVKIQKDCDSERLTYIDIVRKYGICKSTISKARALGLFRPLSASEANKNAWNKYRTSRLAIFHSDSFRRKAARNGGIKKGGGRCKHFDYISPIAGKVHLQGSWEYEYAKYLDSKGIRWERNSKGFPYTYGGKESKYFPDFYLSDEKTFVEIKGYETERDHAKWEQFPEPLRILKGKDLLSLGLNIKIKPQKHIWKCATLVK